MPLIAQRRGPTHPDAEGNAASADRMLTLRLHGDDRRGGYQGQRCGRTIRGAKEVAHPGRVVASVSVLNAANGQGSCGSAADSPAIRQRIPVFKPLIGERRGAKGPDSEGSLPPGCEGQTTGL